MLSTTSSTESVGYEKNVANVFELHTYSQLAWNTGQ